MKLRRIQRRHPSRQMLLTLVVTVLAWFQGLAPLLHVHVVAGSDVSLGIHLPTMLHSASGENVAGIGMQCRGADDSSIVTVPPEHRRDEQLSPAHLGCEVLVDRHVLTLPMHADWLHTRVVAQLCSGNCSQLWPPAQAPPIYS